MNRDKEIYEHLENLFSGNLNQMSFEDAADFMTLHSVKNIETHKYFLDLFKSANELIASRDEKIIYIVSQSMFDVDNFEDAKDIIKDFEDAYKDSYLKKSDQ